MKEDAGSEEAIEGAYRGVNQTTTQQLLPSHRNEVSLISRGQRKGERRGFRKRGGSGGRGGNQHMRQEACLINKGDGK